MGVGDFGAGFRMQPAIVAGGLVALIQEPFLDFPDGGFGAIDVGLGNNEGGALLGGEDAVEPDVVAEDPVAGDDVAQVRDAALRSEVRRQGELHDTLLFLGEKDGMLGLAG